MGLYGCTPVRPSGESVREFVCKADALSYRNYAKPMRRNGKFTHRVNAITVVSTVREKFHFRFYRICVTSRSIPPQREGRTRGRHETRGGRRWTCRVAAWLCRADEQSRCGREVVWSWSPDAEAKP